MFQRMIDNFKDDTGTALRMTSLVVVAGAALFVTIAFLSAAAFVSVLRAWGLIEALVAVASIFLVIAIIFYCIYATKKRQAKLRAIAEAREAARQAKSAASSLLADPMLLATALQIGRTIGLKKLLPLLAVAGAALGYLAMRGEAPADDDGDSDETA